MKEPSVLDYVKSKITFWKDSAIEIPAPESQTAPAAVAPVAATADQAGMAAALNEITLVGEEGADVVASAPVQEPSSQEWTAPRARTAASSTGALLVLGGLGLALVAQAMLEPPNRAAIPAAAFYALAALLVGIAYFRGMLAPADIPATLESAADDQADSGGLYVNLLALAAGLLMMVAAFFLFSTPDGEDVPLFGFVNTTVWLLSIGYLVGAFYLPNRARRLPAFRDRLAAFLRKPRWKITITRWTVVVLCAVALVLFFRFYRLNSVPLDPVSDHAEKLLDVNDVLNGTWRVFFPRNTGREAFQFYWTALIIKIFHTGVTFFSLKLGIAFIGLLALYSMYRLGEEIGSRWVGLLAVVFCGFSYWAQTQARIGLRFSLYAGFYAPMLYYLIRGLRRSNRNDFIWAGLWMGIGLQGYTSYRIVPFVALACFAIYVLHNRTWKKSSFALWGLVILGLVSLAVFLPLFRFALDNPQMVAFRALTRLGEQERPFPGPPVLIFFQNTWNALVMFFWNNGDVWVHSIPGRPALDVISAALFFLGVVLVALRYIRRRNWVDLFMLVSIPLLLLPSILSLAFPNENPNLNRTSAAYVPAFLFLAIGLEGLLSGLKQSLRGRAAVIAPALLGLALVYFSARANFDLVFNQYDLIERQSGWNSPEMGGVVRQFAQTFGRIEDAWVVAYPYWVDTRLVGIEAGYPTRDLAIQPADLQATLGDPRNKLFILNTQDAEGLGQLQALYPQGRYWLYKSSTPDKDFVVFITLAGSEAPFGGAGGQLPSGRLPLDGLIFPKAP